MRSLAVTKLAAGDSQLSELVALLPPKINLFGLFPPSGVTHYKKQNGCRVFPPVSRYFVLMDKQNKAVFPSFLPGMSCQVLSMIRGLNDYGLKS